MKTKNLLIVIALFVATCNVFAQTYVTQVKVAGQKKWGYATLNGELIIPARFEKCYKFSSDGWAAIYDADIRQYFFINLKGEKLKTDIASFKLIDGFGFDVEGFTNGLAPIKQGELWGYLDSKGHVAIPTKFEEAIEFNGGFGVAKLGEKYFVLNTKGEEFIIDVAGILDMKHFSESLAPFRAADKKFGFIGTDGKVAIQAQFQSVGYFNNGLAWAKSDDGVLGYINSKGEWVIKPKFDAGKDFDKESGLARVKTGKEWAYVNKAGTLVYIKDTDLYGDFTDGLATGRKNGLVGFYNNTGEWSIAPQFEAARDFKNGYAAAKKDGKWGVIDTSGNWVMQPTYDGIKDMELVK
ncbi:MAG TPA: WG repeat-containing protein [Chryseolinea sp.]|nr:WG repeat-containing protein [Chryseolinea sp.]